MSVGCRHYFWFGLLMALAGAGFAAEEETAVARVNGVPVAAAELRRALREVRAGVLADFSRPQSAAAKGEAPAEEMQRRARAKLVRLKVQQGLMREHGIWPEIDHAAFLRTFAAENERRRLALARGEVIYGPRAYTEESYFAYLFSNALIRLKAKLAESELRPTEEELQRYYELKKETEFCRGLRAECRLIQASFPSTATNDATMARQRAKTRIEAAQASLRNGAEFEAVAKQFGDTGSAIRRSYTEQEIAVGKLEVNRIAQVAHQLAPGETSDIIEGVDCFAILRLVSRNQKDYVPYAECLDAVRLGCVEARYAELVARLATAARVDVVSAAWTAVQAE